MNPEDRLHTRMNRIRSAVSLEPPDRIPVVLEYSAFAAYVTETSIAEFVSSPAKATETMIRAYHLVGDGSPIELLWGS